MESNQFLQLSEAENAIAFHKWMLKHDTMENAEQYFHYTDEDMYNEYLKDKSKDDIS